MRYPKLIVAALIAAGAWMSAEACSRVVYTSTKGIAMVGRTLDWRTPIPTNIYVYPRGLEKESMPSGPRLQWRSRYASVLAVGYDGGATEGMNEKGLVMNGLFCKGTVYRTSEPTDTKTPVMSLSVIVSYFLDNFATVDEVDTWLKANTFAISGQTFDGGTVSTLHWAFTDPTGETLVMEYQSGKMYTYRGKQYKVLTNDPPMPQMEAINTYWEGIGGEHMLPGTVKSPDRFVRATFFIKHVPDDYEYDQALGCVESIMGTVSVPLGYELPGEPNVSSTQWRSVSDLTGGKYYFHFADTPGDFWIDLGRLELQPGAPILKFDSAKHRGFLGCANGKLEKSKGFTPMW
ncbi:MAG: linear amide C-N hydrolase [Muribaculaceae bacterium]|nr:linear amide C-N hydrolase [Muribaculaceae bacterium]